MQKEFIEMSRVAKKPQFEAFNQRPDCFGRFTKHDYKLADWRKDCPLMLEIGAGKAEISVAFAQNNPDWQVIALDKKSDRLGKAARCNKAPNLVFLQASCQDLDQYLKEKQVDLIWLAFPDPFPKDSQAKHRLTTPEHLEIYAQLLRAGGQLRFKTDSDQLFDYSRQTLQDQGWQITALNYDLKFGTMYPDDVLVVTTYEQRFRQANQPIHYLQAVYNHLRV